MPLERVCSRIVFCNFVLRLLERWVQERVGVLFSIQLLRDGAWHAGVFLVIRAMLCVYLYIDEHGYEDRLGVSRKKDLW